VKPFGSICREGMVKTTSKHWGWKLSKVRMTRAPGQREGTPVQAKSKGGREGASEDEDSHKAAGVQTMRGIIVGVRSLRV